MLSAKSCVIRLAVSTLFGWYWSSSPVVFNSDYSRFVSFNYGYDAYGDKRYNGYVRLVRSSKDGL
jgi:hypothetical protein